MLVNDMMQPDPAPPEADLAVHLVQEIGKFHVLAPSLPSPSLGRREADPVSGVCRASQGNASMVTRPPLTISIVIRLPLRSAIPTSGVAPVSWMTISFGWPFQITTAL